jgi:TPP-dependent trihydroxycyclohexane-1,2-dione (THcHDO) dehydratase
MKTAKELGVSAPFARHAMAYVLVVRIPAPEIENPIANAVGAHLAARVNAIDGCHIDHGGGRRDYPDRQSVAIVRDGGFAMLMAEMTTAVQHNLPVKIIVLKNNSLAEVKFEQIELGNPSFGCDFSPIGFVVFARACGAEGYRCERPEEVRPAIRAALRSPRPALVGAVVDPDEKPTDPDELRI